MTAEMWIRFEQRQSDAKRHGPFWHSLGLGERTSCGLPTTGMQTAIIAAQFTRPTRHICGKCKRIKRASP